MTILQIEHSVPNFDAWKKAFDSDPIGRKRSGVKHYRIFRAEDDPGSIIIHLEFDSPSEAHNALAALLKLWEKPEVKAMVSAKTRILEIAESIELA